MLEYCLTSTIRSLRVQGGVSKTVVSLFSLIGITKFINGVNIMESMSKQKLSHGPRSGIYLLLLIPVLVGLAVWGVPVVEAGAAPAGSSWAWMDRLLLPLVLVGGVYFLYVSGRETGRRLFEERALLEIEISADRQHEEALQIYFDRMSELLLKEKLSRFSPDEVRSVARIRTLAVLRGLDGRRRGSLLLFLRDSRLIDREAVIDLSGAELAGAILPFANLKRLNISEADLSRANLGGANLAKSYLSCTNLSGANLNSVNLSGADLFEANLSGADLTRANLSKANLNGADLRGCCLNGADLSEADLSGANLNVGGLVDANLRGAKLGKAKLLGADLRQADLSRADLSGTEISQTELEKVKSLEGATLPDGTKHE
jgi:uncharacterized protein YjbI with pentapeptide repeats